jgi:hypothetical protein
MLPEPDYQLMLRTRDSAHTRALEQRNPIAAGTFSRGFEEGYNIGSRVMATAADNAAQSAIRRVEQGDDAAAVIKEMIKQLQATVQIFLYKI